MKSRVYLWVLIGASVIALGGCKAQQSAYAQAYERAQARSTVYQAPATQVNTPSQVYERPAVTPVLGNDVFQEEKITVMDGRNLKQYSVVVGSFMNRTNAESLKNRMQAQGYSPVLVQNEKGLYRVIVATYDTRAEAVGQRDAIKRQYPDFYDAWLLNRVY